MEAMNYCRIHRFTPNVVNRFSDIRAVLLSVSAGLGISILPVHLPFGRVADFLRVIPIEDLDASITCAAAWKKSMLNPAAALFLNVLKEKGSGE